MWTAFGHNLTSSGERNKWKVKGITIYEIPLGNFLVLLHFSVSGEIKIIGKVFEAFRSAEFGSCHWLKWRETWGKHSERFVSGLNVLLGAEQWLLYTAERKKSRHKDKRGLTKDLCYFRSSTRQDSGDLNKNVFFLICGLISRELLLLYQIVSNTKAFSSFHFVLF